MNVTRWSHKCYDPQYEESLLINNIPYFFINAEKISTYGFVNTVQGEYEIRVIGVRNLVNKEKIHKEFRKALERRRKNNTLILVMQLTQAPYEIANKIVNFAGR